MQYFFILGKNPDLSISEIISLLETKKIKFENKNFSAEVFIIETDKKIKPTILDELGGSIKFGEVFNISEFDEVFFLEKLTQDRNEKIVWGASFYKLEDSISKNQFFNNQKNLNKKFFALKKELKNEELPSRIVSSKDRFLSAVVVEKNKILDKGADFCAFIGAKEIIFGQTLAIQKFEEYSFRDFQRPARNIISGMLPPKLAKILINLSQTKKTQTLLDPFCGSGTVGQEAVLLGYKKIFCSDISKQAILDSQKNLDWLDKFFKLKILPQFYILDAKNLSSKFGKNEINGIATEPFLGPPLTARESLNELKYIAKKLSQTYLEVFLELKKVLKKNAQIAIIFPVLVYRNQNIYLEILSDLKKAGFSQKKWPDYIGTNHRGGLIYSRPDQKVVREIFVFENK